MAKILMCGDSRVFIEFAKAIQDALLKVPIPSTIHEYQRPEHRENFKFDDVNIFIQGHRINPPIGKLNILIQPEQFWKHSQWQDYSQSKWDLVLEIFPQFLDIHKNSKLLKLGYSKHFDNLSDVKEDVDIHFFGGVTEYRDKYLKKFPFIYRFFPEAYGNDRDVLISRSKVNLNIHVCPNYFVTPIRAMFVLSKGKIFLQEETPNTLDYLNKYLVWFNESNLKEVSNRWVLNDVERNTLGKSIKDEMVKNLNFNDNFMESVYNILK